MQVVDVDDLRSGLSSGSSSRDEVARVCMRNLLANREERVFFKDRESRFLLVSAGWLLAEGQGRSLDEVIGKTDFDIFSGVHATAAFEDERQVMDTGEPIVAKVERETFDDRPDGWVSTTKLALRDEHGRIIGTWGVSRDVTAQVGLEETIRRRAEGQEEIADLGRLALTGAPLEVLFDQAVGAAWRILSSDCAWLVEWLPDAPGAEVRAEVGWLDECKGERIVGEEHSLSDFAVRSREPVVVDDWEQEHRFLGSGRRLTRGVRSSVGVLVGDPDSPFGVLEVQYTQPNAVPPDCISFLRAAANVLGEAIQSRNAQEMIRHQALHDGLTGLANRTLVLDRAEQMLARTRRQHTPMAVLLVDVDGFKHVNDTFGHAAGDTLLRAMAARLSSVVREVDTVGRLGGDEFVVLLDSLTLDAGPELVAERVLDVLRQPIRLDEQSHRPVMISASIGIAAGTEETVDQLLHAADLALYDAKDAGKNRYVLFEPSMQTVAKDRLLLELDLREALEADQLFLLYQPTFDLRTETVTGVEALLRWRHPSRGVLEPDQFIPIAEDTTMIAPIGRWVLQRACQQAADWRTHAPAIGIAVNISAHQLDHDELLDDVADALAASGLDPPALTLEITETTLMRHPEATVRRLAQLKTLGVRVAIDDFGTGYSSLGYLRTFPVDALKIDRSFISGIGSSPESTALIHTLVQLGKTLNLETVGEGIEQRSQLQTLQGEDCDIGQGFLLARPLEIEAVERLLKKIAVHSPTQTPETAPQPRR
jgi:diguanylate cyclase (GGDEF)-like protein